MVDEVFNQRVAGLNFLDKFLEDVKPKISKKSYNVMKRILGKHWMRVDPNPPIPHEKFEEMFS